MITVVVVICASPSGVMIQFCGKLVQPYVIAGFFSRETLVYGIGKISGDDSPAG